MKRIICLVLLMFCAGLLQAAERVVAAVPRSFPPYYIEDSTGVMTGFAIEVMERIAREADLMVEYQRYDSWHEVMQALREGRADLIPNVGITPERSEWLDFSRPVERFSVSSWVRADTLDIAGPDDLAGRRLAVVRENVGVALVAGIRGANVEVMRDPEDAIFILLSGRVEALIYPDPVIMYISGSAGFKQRLKRVGEPLALIERAVGVRKGNPDLLERIDSAVANLISSRHYREIYARWIMPQESFWSAKRVTISLSSLVLLVVIVGLIWRYSALIRVNEGLLLELRRSEKVQRERDRMITAIEQAAETILITDAAGTIVYANPAFSRVTGYAMQEVLGRNPSILKSGRHDADFYGDMWQTISGGHVWQGHLINRRKDGSLYEEDASISPIRDRDGQVVSYVAVKRDITNEMRLEKQLRQSQKMEAIGTLAGGVAHDFNNILSIILGAADIARESRSADKVNKYLDDIMGAGLRAKDLVQQILSVSRMREQELKPIRMGLVVKETLKLLRSSIPSTIEIRSSLCEDKIDGDCCRVLADPIMIHQIVVNLATNAYQALRETGGVLRVDLELADVGSDPLLATGSYIRLIVSDNGPGIAPELLERIFDPYFTTKELGEGTGLGLSIVRSIVEQLGGTIDVCSEPGKGTSFKVYLPRCDYRSLAEAELVEVELPAGSERIMVVDDEEILRLLLADMLESQGYTVESFGGPDEALARFRTGSFDLVITDLTMPNMTGLELVRRLRRLSPELPVIMCTGFYDEDVRRKAEAVGIRHCLSKPVVRRDLARAIRDLLDK